MKKSAKSGRWLRPIQPGNETISPRRRSNPETNLYQKGTSVSVSIRIGPMIEAITAFLSLFSASIFLAHAINAYLQR